MSLARIATASALLASVACATPSRPGDQGYEYNVTGSYSGRFMIDDQIFEATLQMRTTGGGRVSGGFRVVAPVEIDGSVDGAVADDLFRITVTYRSANGCNDRIEGILTVEPGGGTIDGPITVTDCGEPIAGRMSFRRTDRLRPNR